MRLQISGFQRPRECEIGIAKRVLALCIATL